MATEEKLYTQEEVDALVELASKAGMDYTADQIEEFDPKELYERILANPRMRNFQRRREIASGIEGGVEALRTLTNAATARRQIDEARRLENELQDPAAPPTTPKSTELAEATEMARRDATRTPIELDPLMQRNMDLLRQDIAQGDVMSGGQSAVAGSLRQSAVNRARSANAQLIPALENIRRQKQAEYNRLIQAGIGEGDMRFKQAMQKYRVAENRYLTEAQAIGALGAAGRENLYNQQQNLYDLMGQAVQPMADFNWQNQAPEATTDAATVGGQAVNLYDPQQAAYGTGGLNQSAINNTANRYVGYSALEGLDPKYGEMFNRVNLSLENQLNNMNSLKQKFR